MFQVPNLFLAFKNSISTIPLNYLPMKPLLSKAIKTLSCATLLLLSRCINDSIGVVNYSTTVTVTDMNNKPLAGQKVKIIYGYSVNQNYIRSYHLKDSAITDNTGKVTLTYPLSISESHSDNAVFVTEDDTTWKSAEYVNQSFVSASTKKVNLLNFSIRKDSLMPVMIRLQKTNNTISGKSIVLFSERQNMGNSQIYSAIDSRIFYEWSRDSIAQLDTTFTIKTYSKIGGRVTVSYLLKQNSQNFWIQEKEINFNPSNYKDKPLLIQL